MSEETDELDAMIEADLADSSPAEEEPDQVENPETESEEQPEEVEETPAVASAEEE